MSQNKIGAVQPFSYVSRPAIVARPSANFQHLGYPWLPLNSQILKCISARLVQNRV
jgi:hypothetical protein